MLHLIPRSEFHLFPHLLSDMFNDRASLFIDKLGWKDLHRDPRTGWERDQYDNAFLDPVYAIVEGVGHLAVKSLTDKPREEDVPQHFASSRLLLMSGRNMIDEIFPHLVKGAEIDREHTLEVSRFCPSPRLSPAQRHMSIAILLYSGIVMSRLNPNIKGFIGIQEQSIARRYNQLGFGSKRSYGDDELNVSYWTEDEFDNMEAKLRDLHTHGMVRQGVIDKTSADKEALRKIAEPLTEDVFDQVARATAHFVATYPHFKPRTKDQPYSYSLNMHP